MNHFSSSFALPLVCMAAYALLAAPAPRAFAQRVSPVSTSLEQSAVPSSNAGGEPSADVENPPPPAKPDPNAPTETEILATNGADFSSKDRVAVFLGDVRVNDPRFQLACDKLTVFLNKGASTDVEGGEAKPKAGNTPPPPVNSAGKGRTEPSNPGGGIDHAIAQGHVIIIQKRAPAKEGEEPKISIGRAEWATFDNKTGDMVLHGTPSVEQNGNTHVALSPATIMTLHRDNSMNTVGPSRTVIKQQHKEEDSTRPGGAPGATGKPAGKPRSAGNGAQG
jgi:lipopolysaccharide export system protein LptA